MHAAYQSAAGGDGDRGAGLTADVAAEVTQSTADVRAEAGRVAEVATATAAALTAALDDDAGCQQVRARLEAQVQAGARHRHTVLERVDGGAPVATSVDAVLEGM